MSLAVSDGAAKLQQHVPAWKRIGLKLKFAKDTAGGPETQSFTPDSKAIAIRDYSEDQPTIEDARPSKKRKVSRQPVLNTDYPRQGGFGAVESTKTSTSKGPKDSTARTTTTISPIEQPDEFSGKSDVKQLEQRQQNGEDLTQTEPLAHRKSVSFTPDTKSDDGALNGSAASHARTADLKTADADSATSSHLPSRLNKQTKAKKRHDSEADRAALENPTVLERERLDRKPDTGQTPEYVKYLVLFHEDRQSWKFNKKKQTAVLANLFDIHHIPPKHDEALYQYVAGLQGSGVRQRVFDSATAVLKSIAAKDGETPDLEEMESEEARRTAYSAALKRHIERFERAGSHRSEHDELQFEEMSHEVEKGRRAEEVLSQLLQREVHPAQLDSSEEVSRTPQSTTPKPDSASTPRTSITDAGSSRSKSGTKSKRKKRKTRTEVSSNDSSSDSGESEGGFTPARGPATVQAALRTVPNPELRSRNSYAIPAKPATGKKIIFDDDLLDQLYPKKPSYDGTSTKRKAGETASKGVEISSEDDDSRGSNDSDSSQDE